MNSPTPPPADPPAADTVVVDGANRSRALWAHVAPLVVFAALLLAQDLAGRAGLVRPEYWVHPLQAVLCGAVLLWFRREYRFRPLDGRALAWGFGVGVLALAIWVSPQVVFGVKPRTENGFDPTPLAGQPALYWTVLGARLVRLAVVVPFVEEVFWRGFLLRYIANEDFARAAYRFHPLAFGVVVAGFTFEHGSADWAAAAVVGVLYNLVAIRTQSLGACVLAHAVTNAGLGAYILATRQWGFW